MLSLFSIHLNTMFNLIFLNKGSILIFIFPSFALLLIFYLARELASTELN